MSSVIPIGKKRNTFSCLVLLLTVFWINTVGSQTPVPFECDGSAYLISSPSGTVPSSLYVVQANNPTIVHATITPSIPDRYNGIGYNFEDNLIYGFAQGDPPSLNPADVVRIDAEGTVTRLGVPQPTPGQVPGMATWAANANVNANGGRVGYAAGVVGLDHKLYTLAVTNNNTAFLVTVDLTTMTYTTVRLSLDISNIVDLAFSPYNGFLYGISSGRLIRINPNNGNQAIINPSSGTIPANLAAGGAWNDVQGRIYFYANGTTPNRLYRYNPANNAFVNVSAADPYPTFDATACFPTRMEKQVNIPAEGLVPGDEVEFEFSIYNSQMLPMTYDFEDVLASADLSWISGSVEPAAPGGGTVSISGQTLTISGVTVQPSAATGEPLTFRVSVKVADNASYGSCYSNQATISQGGTMVVSDNPDTEELNDPTLFCLNECDLPAPTSGGNIQECANDPIQKITATATVPDGVQLIWYDAPAGGNVVTDPSLETVGTVTYYAAADDGTCISQNRTPVTLNILPTPLLDEIEDVEECVSYELPVISGSNLTGNEAYYTEPNGGGVKYLPGDVIEDIGSTTLYVYDEMAAMDNCEGVLTVASNTNYIIDDLFEDGTHHQYPGATNSGFWQGTANQQILYNSPGTPVGDQIYLGLVGDVSIDDTSACFGTEVNINAQVTITNQGPGNGAGYSGRLAIINKSTDEILYQTQLTANFPATTTMTPTVTGTVPAADVLAGNIAIMVAVETYQGTFKNWQVSGFNADYQFQPENTQACSDEQSFELTINDLPELVITDPGPECLPGTVDLTDAAVTAGSTAGLIYNYFEDAEGTVELSGPESVSETGTYYIRGEDPATGCSTIMPVEVILIDAPEVSIGQPVCIDGEGSIEVISPLGAQFEYSINGADYQSAAVFESVAPGTYMVTVRNTTNGCVSLGTEAVVDNAPTAPAPVVTQPDCESPTGTIHVPRYENASYSIDGGASFSGLNTFSELEPGDYSVVVRADGCDSDPVTVTIEEAPLVPASPVSGGDQIVCAEDPVQTMTATASVEAGETLVWYDAPIGGNVVADPSLNAVGVVTYYAEANNGTCPSLNRTAVTLMIQEAPYLDTMEDQEACEEYVLPEIEGTGLSGNEAYYTEANGGGTRLEPGDTINTVGTTTLYIFDEIKGEFNCSGTLSAVSTTKVTQSGLEEMWFQSLYLTDDYDSAIWNGTSTAISYDTTDPVINGQTYKTIVADVVFSGDPGCFGSAIRINPRMQITNTGPDTGRAYSGEVAVVNNVTNEIIARSQQLLNTPVNDPVDIDFTTGVSIEDLTEGNISIVIIVETYHGDDYIKDWTIENFSVDYQYLPEFTPSCPDEESFDVTIYEMPVADAGEEQTQYNDGIFTLDAATPAFGTGEWSVVDGILAEAISDVNEPGATVTLDPNTSVTLRWTVTNGTCSSFDDVVLNYVSQADIVTVKVTGEAGQTEYVPGETVEYTITITNNGPSAAEQVNIVDVDPAGAEIAGWTAEVVAGTVTLPNTSGTGSIDEIIDLLPAGAEVRYNVTVQTFPHSVEELVNAVQVTSPTEDPDPDCPDCETPPLEPDPLADIVTVKVTSDAGQTEFIPGESVEYTITVTNNGPSDAGQVNVTDTAPAGTMISNWTAEVTSGTVTLPNTSGTDDINETISILPHGATVTYTVTVQTPPDFTDDLVNAVQVTSPTEDPDPDCPDCETPPLEPNPQADIVTVKVTSDAGQTEFVPGESVEYTITVTNNGPSDAEQVNVTDTAPAGTAITNWTAEVTTGTVTLPNTSGTDDINETISTLPNGAVVTYTVTVQTPPDFTDDLVNAVQVTSPTEDPDPDCPDCETPPLEPNPQADIVTVKVTSDAGQTEFVPGESVEYTITVTNNGPSDAQQVNVTDTAPAGTAITNWTAEVTTGTVTLPNTSGTDDINETISTLPNGAVVTYTVTVQTPPDFTDDLVNAVQVTSPTEDPDPDCPDCETPPLEPNPQADIVTVKVTSDAGQTEFVPGESVEYTITVTNNGPSDAEQVNVVDTAPAGTTISNWAAVVTSGTVTLPNTSGTDDINETISILPDGATVTYTVTVQTPPDFTDDLVNAVQVTSPTEDPDPDCPDCETPPLEPNPQADIVTVKVTSDAGQTEFVPGESVEYTITVTNNGPSDAEQVNVVDTAPAGTTISNWAAVVTSGTVTLPNTSGTDDINETISILPDGATVTYTVTVQTPPDFTDDLVNAVQVTSPTEDPDPDCPDCETPPLEPNPQADIVTVKVTSAAGQTEFVPGESVEYTITVTNNGPSDAEQVNVVDTAPAGTTISNWTAVVTSGTVTLPNTSGTDDINETISILPDGATVTYTVTVQTPPDFTDDLVNAVQVTSPTEDPDPDCPDCETPPLEPNPQADIVTVKATSDAGQTEFIPGESVEYTITVTNNGPSDAQQVNVTDTAPAGTTITNWTAEIISGTVTLPNTSGTDDINETINTFPNGAVVTYKVTVQTPPDFTDDLVNAVQVTSPTEDPDPDCPDCETPPLEPNPQADIVTIKVTSDAGQTEYVQGESVDYTITVTNNGPSDAQQVNVVDTAPAGTTIINWAAAVTSGTVTLPNTSGTDDINEMIPTLPNGAIVTYTVTVQTPPDFTDDLVNAVQVTSPTEDPDPDCPDCETPPLEMKPEPSIALIKTAEYIDSNSNDMADAGDEITYTFTVTNTGNVDINNITIDDDLTGTTDLPITPATLAPGETGAATATYTIIQSDVDNGGVSNQALATGEAPNGDPVEDISGTSEDNDTPTDTPIIRSPSIALVKTADYVDSNGNGMSDAGDEITYVFTVTNTGNVTVDNITVDDDLTGTAGLALTPSTLAPGETGTATAMYTITQSDVDNGGVSNQALAGGTDPNGDPVEDESGTGEDNDDPTDTPLTQEPSIALVKSVTNTGSGENGAFVVGDAIEYTFTVSNTGNVTVSDITIDDALTGTSGLPITPSTLAPGETGTATAMYTITQSDVDNGGVSNQALASGEDPNGDPIEDESGTDEDNDDPTDTPIEQTPSIALIKSVTNTGSGENGAFVVGDAIEYTFTVSNTGNVTVSDITIDDALTGTSGLPITPASLAPGETGTAMAMYTITQSDVDNGGVSNQALASGEDPNGDPIEDESGTDEDNDDPTDTPIEQTPSIALIKSVTNTGSGDNGAFVVGDAIEYTFTVSNTGNVTVSDITIDDALTGTSGLPIIPASLAPGETGTAIAMYTITQSDVDNGGVSNQALASGEDPNGDPIEDESGTDEDNDDPTDTPIEQNPSIALVKSVTNTGSGENGAFVVGDAIEYTFTVTNTGNVTVADINIDDALTDTNGLPITPSTLTPGETGTATAMYTITQSDVDNGGVSNQALASGEDPNGDPIEDESGTDEDNDDPTDTPIEQNPSIALVKSVTNMGSGENGAFVIGDAIEYTFTVTNTGNVTVADINIDDALTATNGLPITPSTLAPGETGTATAMYTITQSDVDNGGVSNQALASGNDPNGDPIEDESGTDEDNDDPTDTPIEQNPSIALVKTGEYADINDNDMADAGDEITYTFTVTNTGNVTVDNITIDDALTGTEGLSITPAVLTPGETGTATATYTITQEDVDNGGVSNQALATGTDPNGDPVEDESGTDEDNNDPTETVIEPNPDMTLIKAGVYVDENGDGAVTPGDIIQYSFTVENTGNVTLNNVSISDETMVPALEVSEVSPPALAPGETGTASAVYVITQEDINIGAVYNIAEASAETPDGEEVYEESQPSEPLDPSDPFYMDECPDCTVVKLERDPAITLLKTGEFNDENGDGQAQAGETITYRFEVTNTGNVFLDNIEIEDPLPGVTITGGPVSLAPGESDNITFSGTYTITQDDIIARGVTNQATVYADATDGSRVSNISDSEDGLGDAPTFIELDGCTIEVFNGVSPNGDGLNDTFKIQGIECYPDNTVEIYNRWGVKVYDVRGYDNNSRVFRGYSDGRATLNQGKRLPTGTYFYVLKYRTENGNVQDKSGYLFIN